METVLYILLALWFAMIAAFALCLLVLAWRTFMGRHQSPELSQKDRFTRFLSAYPQIMRILWWTLVGFTILVATIKGLLSL